MLGPNIQEFTEFFESELVVNAVASRLDWSTERIRSELVEWINEVPMGLETVSQHLAEGQRVLEVGAGAGLLSMFLAAKGHEIVALEPIGLGYDFFRAFRQAFEEVSPWSAPQWLEIGAEDLAPEGPGALRSDLLH